MSGDPRLPELFAAAHELTPEERRRYLAALDGDQPELAAELRELLARDTEGARRLAGNAWERFAAETGPPPLPEAIGPYRILSEIGRGGMGRVFLAEEVRAAFRRRLALKVIDRPWAAPDRARRFRSEVRILASLEHAGIARFLDGGQLPDGTWFLALEHVEGEDLLAHAARLSLPFEARIRLVLEVLQAVAYAHDQGVVHRDLKPANILVDRHGRTRLLDFGVAKLLEEDDEAGMATTLPEMRAFTPAYASPEQFTGAAVSVASDVYSAGVVLYELITGERPFGGDGTSRAELERAVLSTEPAAPSARLSTAAKTAPASTGRPGGPGRDGESVKLHALDAVCLKALRRDPAERYASARELASDLERLLAGLPVVARRDAARRANRRRRWTLAAGLALVTMLGVALARRDGSGAAPVEPAPRPFPFSAAALPEVAELARRFDAAPASLEAGAALAIALVREQRADEAALIVARLRQIEGPDGDPLVDYVAATLAGLRSQPQQALVLFERALARARATGRGELVGQIRAARGRVLSSLGRREEARSEMAAARDDFERAGDLASVARVLNDLAIEAAQANDLAEATRLFEAALAATRSASPANTGATFLMNLGILDRLRGRPDLARPRFEEVVATFRDLDRPFRLSGALANLADALWDLGVAADAAAAAGEALTLGRPGGAASSLDHALLVRATIALEAGDVVTATAASGEADHLAQEVGAGEVAGRAQLVRFRLARSAGRIAEARSCLAIARRLLESAGALEILVDADLDEAAMLTENGEIGAARARIESTLTPLRGHGARAAVTLGELLLARLDVQEGAAERAGERLAELEKSMLPSTMVSLTLAHDAARGELAAAHGDWSAAQIAFARGRRVAEGAGRRESALGFLFDSAQASFRAGDRGGAHRVAAAVDRAARAAGWLGLAERARRLAQRSHSQASAGRSGNQ